MVDYLFPECSANKTISNSLMTNKTLQDLLEQAEHLTVEEQLSLIAHLVEKVKQATTAPKPKRKWSELRGLVTEPALGEDAQTWISRTRREADSHRASQVSQSR